MSRYEYDVVIIGGGISGCSLMYLLSAFTDIHSIGLLEKYDHLDPLNVIELINPIALLQCEL